MSGPIPNRLCLVLKILPKLTTDTAGKGLVVFQVCP